MFQNWKSSIVKNIEEIIRKEITTTPWNKKILEELAKFSITGKCVRGGLFLNLFGIAEQSLLDIHYKAAAAIELTHSALLIHDDIMDGDTERRNQPTMHCRFQPPKFGNSVAICVGDIGFWIACKHIVPLGHDSFDFYIQEMINVACGQIQDVAFDYKKDVHLQEILEMYSNKTARYTFLLPIMLYCICTQQAEDKTHIYQKLSYDIGVLFQIIDDELDILGDKKHTGKAVGTDLLSLKKNIYWYYLQKNHFPFEKIHNNLDIQKVRSFILRSNVQSEINLHKEQLSKKVDSNIKHLKNKKEQDFFYQLKDYITNRNK